MARYDEIQRIIKQLLADADPAALMRSLVIQSGGHWVDPCEDTLFEIHFLSVAGSGIGAQADVENWVKNALRLQIDVETFA